MCPARRKISAPRDRQRRTSRNTRWRPGTARPHAYIPDNTRTPAVQRSARACGRCAPQLQLYLY